MPQHVPITEIKVRPFKPDVLIYTAHTNEIFRGLRRFAKVLNSEEVLKEYPFLREISKKAGVEPGMIEGEVRRRIEPYAEDLYNWGLQRISKVCEEDGIIPVMIYIQALGDDPMKTEHVELRAMAKAKDFVFIDLHDIFDDVSHLEMATAKFDMHPNAKGHQKIADRLYEFFASDVEFKQRLSNIKKNK